MSDKTQKSFASLKGWLLAVGGALLATGTVYAAEVVVALEVAEVSFGLSMRH